MYDPHLNKLGKLLWIVIAVVVTVLFSIYFYNENKSLLVISLCPIVTVLVWEALGRTTTINAHYYPKNLLEYVVENVAFFGVYLVVHLLLKDRYVVLQAVYVVCMVAIVAFDTYAIARVMKSANR